MGVGGQAVHPGEGGIDIDVAQLRVVDAHARGGAVQYLPQDRVVQR